MSGTGSREATPAARALGTKTAPDGAPDGAAAQTKDGDDGFTVAGKRYTSRLLVGTGKFWKVERR